MTFKIVLLLMGTAFLVLVSGCATSRNVSGDSRTLWIYENGSFENKKGKTWIEINPDIRRDVGRIEFKETGRTAKHVLLYDASRDMTVRLSATSMEWRQYGRGEWKVHYTGFWKR